MMRLWSIHPSLLDQKGLVALWREALLAQKVLRGQTKGYRSHPQLQRFRACPTPLSAIAAYLRAVHEEASSRGYAFDSSKIARSKKAISLPVTRGQLIFELQHLKAKLLRRDPRRYRDCCAFARFWLTLFSVLWMVMLKVGNDNLQLRSPTVVTTM
jgi:hypothetical protein